MNDAFLEPVTRIAHRAGEAILDIYAGDFDVETKDDDSPVTAADMAAHQVIVEGLGELTPGLPILSEEAASIPWEERGRWDTYWLVDPLDGTREFIKRNGEFTVNIALVREGRPIIGVIHAPALKQSWLGCEGVGAFRHNGDGEPEPIQPRRTVSEPTRVLVSRSHPSPEVAAMLERLGPCERIAAGSSLKFCRIAEGAADFYPRTGTTCEWDTAAGQGILEAAGGQVVDREGRPLRYNRKRSLENPHFLAFADPDRDWLGLWSGD